MIDLNTGNEINNHKLDMENDKKLVDAYKEEKELLTSNEIKEIRNMLSENKDYDVSLDYDSNGYVNKFTIEDIESNKIATESNTNTSNNNSSVQIPSVDDIDISSSEYEQIKEEMEQKLDEMKEAYNNR